MQHVGGSTVPVYEPCLCEKQYCISLKLKMLNVKHIAFRYYLMWSNVQLGLKLGYEDDSMYESTFSKVTCSNLI